MNQLTVNLQIMMVCDFQQKKVNDAELLLFIRCPSIGQRRLVTRFSTKIERSPVTTTPFNLKSAITATILPTHPSY